MAEYLRKLLQDKSVSAYIDTGVICPEIVKNPQSIYSFLLVAGYLKLSEAVLIPDGNYMCKVCIIVQAGKELQKAILLFKQEKRLLRVLFLQKSHNSTLKQYLSEFASDHFLLLLNIFTNELSML